jgi:inosine-uridine nucleoside N-ribohydrolase
MLYIDSDNALGSLMGDVDDGFAVAALLASQVPVLALGAVGGNTRSSESLRNLKQLANLFEYHGPVLLGANPRDRRRTIASHFLQSQATPFRIVALGPLTNVAHVVRSGTSPLERVVMVGTYLKGRSWFGAIRDLNVRADVEGLRDVYKSDVPLTIVPLDVCCRLRADWAKLERLSGTRGQFFRLHARRWWRRAKWLKASKDAPLWDLVAALYEIDSKLFETKTERILLHSNGNAEYGAGDRKVEVVTDFSPDACWQSFVNLFEDASRRHPAM